MAFSNVHYISIYQTVTSLTYVFVLLAFRPLAFGFTPRLPNSDESPTPALNVCYNPFCLRGLHTN
ncbi:hypothetical protein DVP73_19965 [Yersinia enterocolitica]|uniref:Uncharacterized protein n=1 Tax=Yersinia enterocolitica TaxID=630 RepID=B0RKN6_YEREN|nr:hypothetical protein [Yersinia enterocolitica]EKN5934509.1 hypothetical protein [Yersinia enterocolitica]CAP20143.1 hypothetical protein [Yersinia enterocolitica]